MEAGRHTSPKEEPAERSFLGPIAGLALGLALAGVNRLGPWSDRPFLGYAFIRWRDILAMFLLTPALAAALWHLGRRARMGRGAEYTLLTLIVVLAVSMGIHEPTNTLSRPSAGLGGAARESVVFLDDTLSHLTFFAGFCGTSVLLVWAQLRRPRNAPESRAAMAGVAALALLLAVTIFANLAFEKTRLDMAVGLATLAAAVALWTLRPAAPRRAPLVFFIVFAYGLGFVGAVLYQAL